MEQRMEEAARWDVTDLPPKNAHDARRIKVTQGLRDWIAATYDVEGDQEEKRWKRLAAAALDSGMLADNEYVEMTGKTPPRVRVGYVNWWITGHYDGMITMTWICFAHNGVTRDQVIEAMRGNKGLLVDVSREIERLSSPAAGNG